MKTQEFRIKKDGSVVATADGYVGGACVDDAEKFFQALGGDVKEQELLSDYYRHGEEGVNVFGN